MSETALQVVGSSDMGEMTVAELVRKRGVIVDAMKSAMAQGTHYGLIPGTGKKPSLLQPGAQLLAHLFRLVPHYTITRRDGPGDNVEFETRCTLVTMGREMFVAEGVGLCSSRESKYRYRNAAAEIAWTGDPVPRAYWNNEDKVAAKALLAEQYGTGAGVKKNAQGEWEVVIYSGGDGKVENENPADVANTILKMSKKRAFVDAVITATASSDMFTQDVEDLVANQEAAAARFPTPAKAADPVPAAATPEPAQDAGKPAKRTRAGTSKQEPAKQEPAPQPEAEEIPPESWREDVCDMFKPDSKMHGKRLGDLPTHTLIWLRDYFGPMTPEKRGRKGRRIWVSIQKAFAEGSAAVEGAANPAAAQPGDDLPEPSYKAALKERITALQITETYCLAQSREAKVTGAKTWEELTESDAQKILIQMGAA